MAFCSFSQALSILLALQISRGQPTSPSGDVRPFVATYEWQHAPADSVELPAGLEVDVPLGDEGGVRARIPATWRLQIYVDTKFNRPQFVRMDVSRHSHVAEILFIIAQFAAVAPERVELMLQENLCRRVALPSTHVNQISLSRALSSKKLLERQPNATIEKLDIFHHRQCLAVRIQEWERVQLRSMAEIGQYIRPSIECREESRCNNRFEIREKCVSRHGAEKCAFEVFLLHACFNRCNILRENPFHEGVERSRLPPLQRAMPRLLRSKWTHGAESTIPDKNVWSQCWNCAVNGTDVLLFGLPHTSALPHPAIASRHRPYFLDGALESFNFQHISTAYPRSNCVNTFELPAVIAELWSITNVYHLLFDFIFPLLRGFRDMPRGVHLFLRLGHPWQASRIHEIVRGDFSPAGDGPPGFLLRALTGRLPVRSIAGLQQNNGPNCFRDLRLGVSLKGSTLLHGIEAAAKGFPAYSVLTQSIGRPQTSGFAHEYSRALSRVVGEFAVMRQKMSLLLPPPIHPKGENKRRRILIVRRKGSRRIENSADVERAARERAGLSFEIDAVSLEDLPFTEQLRRFRFAAIQISAHGQGASNTAFIQPGSVLLLLMPPSWFGWHWLYSNAAIEVGVNAVVPSPPLDDKELFLAGWQGFDNDRVNQRRDEPFKVDIPQFLQALHKAIETIGSLPPKITYIPQRLSHRRAAHRHDLT